MLVAYLLWTRFFALKSGFFRRTHLTSRLRRFRRHPFWRSARWIRSVLALGAATRLPGLYIDPFLVKPSAQATTALTWLFWFCGFSWFFSFRHWLPSCRCHHASYIRAPATHLHTRSDKPRTCAWLQPLHGCKASRLLGRFYLPQLHRIFLLPFFMPFFLPLGFFLPPAP